MSYISEERPILRAEHDSSANVAVKKVGNYGWDVSSLEWVRLKVNNDGELIVNTEPNSTNLEGGGKVSVGTTAVEATFTSSTKSIIISADIDNTGTLYIGKSNVTSVGANAFAFLLAGESITINYDDAINAVYVVASAVSQNFWKGSLI